VEITHRNLYAQMQTFIRHYGLTEQSRLMNLLPLHHTNSHPRRLRQSAGALTVRPWRFSVDVLPKVLDGIYKHRITHCITVPSGAVADRQSGRRLSGQFRHARPQVRYFHGGVPRRNLWRSFEQRYRVRIVSVYGLTGRSAVNFTAAPTTPPARSGTIGKPVDSEARVVDDSGAALPKAQTGELCLRGDHIMKGYFRMPEETAKVLKDGWFHTGDLCWQDDAGSSTSSAARRTSSSPAVSISILRT
jgi:long-chain acyl-CoA synthetase